jgi:hypothetical protein
LHSIVDPHEEFILFSSIDMINKVL